MALLPVHKYFVFNKKLQPNYLFVPSENEGGIYEVLRVDSGIPLFLEDHLKRLFLSAKLAGREIRFKESEIENLLYKLITGNEVTEGNILISYKINLKIFFIHHSYPTSEMYEDGVDCGVLDAERENPNAKVFQTTVRQQANQLISGHDYYEVLLVNHFGRVTEGSRSNVFFVKDSKIVTPPANEVLLGITRQKTIELAERLGIEVREEDVFYDKIQNYKAVFLTGTSPKILPVRKLGDILFELPVEIVNSLIKNYDDLIAGYIQKRINK